MKRQLLYITCALSALIATACGDPVNDYYVGKNKNSTEGTIREGLEAKGEYSEFLALLVETDMLGFFEGSDDLLTVWVPVNGSLPAGLETMDADEKLKLVQNHISTSIIDSRSFDRLKRVKTLCEKYLDVESADGFSIDGVELLSPDMIHDNGIIHGISDWLVPRINIYQWLEQAPDNFSMIRDSILKRNTRTFDDVNSTILGVDENGRIYYDTVWKTTNDILDAGHPAIENERYSLFIPDNAAVRAMIEDYEAFLDGVQYEHGDEDKALWFDWLMRAAIYNGTTDFGAGTSIRSVHGLNLRADYQQVDSREVLSNGVVFKLSKCHVPRDLYYDTRIFNPYYIRVDRGGPTPNPGLDYFENIADLAYQLDENTEYALLQFLTSNSYYRFLSYNFNDEEGLHPVPVLPGKYNVRARLRNFVNGGISNQTDSLHFYINDQHIAKVTGILTGQYNTETGGIIATDIEVTGIYEPVEMEIRIPYPTGVAEPGNEYRRIGIGRVTLVPTDNY